MKTLATTIPIHLWSGATDMRLGIDRLEKLIHRHFHANPKQDGAFVFFNRDRSRVKIMYWDRNGFAVWMKQLQAGTFLVEEKDGRQRITAIDLKKLLAAPEMLRGRHVNGLLTGRVLIGKKELEKAKQGIQQVQEATE